MQPIHRTRVIAIGFIALVLMLTIAVFVYEFAIRSGMFPEVPAVHAPVAAPLLPSGPNAEQPCGPTDNCVSSLSGVMSDSCAPWDGPAIDVTVPYDGATLRIEFTGGDIVSLLAGKEVVVGKNMGEAGAESRFNLCGGNGCRESGIGEIRIQSAAGPIVKTSEAVRFDITVDGSAMPLEVKWDHTPALCG